MKYIPTQEEILELIKKEPGISQYDIKNRLMVFGGKLSTQLCSMRKKKLITREPSKNVKMSFDYYPLV